MPHDVPEFDHRFVIVADRDNVEFAAVLSSYLVRPGTYLPMFSFPRVEHENGAELDEKDDKYVARIIGIEVATKIRNCVAQVRDVDTVIFAGLNDVQRSYQSFPGSPRIIDIKTIDEIEPKLRDAGIEFNEVSLACRPEQSILGLYVAASESKALRLDPDAPDVAPPEEKPGGLVAIEALADHISSVIGVNYALAVGANIAVYAPLAEREHRDVLSKIEQWRNSGSAVAKKELYELIEQRVGATDFVRFDYATFFTTGLPYSILVDNAIPCSYVHLRQWADLFVATTIAAERANHTTGAVVFSLDEFDVDGETQWLVDYLNHNSYYVRDLIGGNATTQQFSYTAQHFPYCLFHIASHGGQMDGYEVVLPFTDRAGDEHVVIYDEVATFARSPGPGNMIQVASKAIFRSFDGHDWHSEERHNLGLPHYVYEDMRNVMHDRESWKGAQRVHKAVVTSSCAIECSNGHHQGMFRTIAAYQSPLIFNNSCSSWYEIAQFFITSGARAYIGTIWDVRNDVAAVAAEAFYEAAIGRRETIIAALHVALKEIETSSDRNIYMLWGLHFSMIPKPANIGESGSSVLHYLTRTLDMYVDALAQAKAEDVRRNYVEAVTRLFFDIVGSFDFNRKDEYVRSVKARMAKIMSRKRRGGEDAESLSLPSALRQSQPRQTEI